MRRFQALVLLGLAAASMGAVDVLLLIPHRYGANYNFNRDQFERMGWEVTTAAVADSVQPCYGGLPWLAVDTLVSQIDDVSSFDAVAIMSATWRYQPDPYGDLISDPDAMALVTGAVLLGIPLYAPCASPRILAAADLLEGVSMQGEPGDQGQFLAEYLAAGADYLGTHLPPVIFGNIVTATRGQYYQRENCQAVGTAMIPGSFQSPVVSGEACPERSRVSLDGALWSRTYGGGDSDGAADVFACDDGGFVLAGYTWSFGAGNSDMLLVRTDPQGEVEWSATFGGSGWERANSVAGTSDGGFVAAGYTTSQGQGLQDILVVRTDGSGSPVWTATFGGPGLDIAMSVIEDDSGCFLVCGYTESSGAGENDACLLKLGPGGELLWERTYGGSALETADCVIQTEDGNCLLAGATGSSTTNSDALLVKVDPDGELIWSQYYDGAGGEGGYDRANSVCEFSGGYAVAGDSNEPDLCGAMLLVADQAGSETFMEFYGGSFYDYGTDIVHCDDGGFIMCGATKDPTSCMNSMFAVKLDAGGSQVWFETFGDLQGSHWGSAICRTGDGNYLIAGQTCSAGAGSFDMWAVKIEDTMAGTPGVQVCSGPDIFPNPADGSIQLGHARTGEDPVRIFDLSGRCVIYAGAGEAAQCIDVSGLAPGTYCLVSGGENGPKKMFTVLR
jgi:putative intracellular protease/amidase